MIGEKISHYTIREKLGQGGMGVVYKAEDTKLRRTVALKFLARGALADEEEKRRFMHEAQAAAALDHPSICTIFEIEEINDEIFIAMACIEGSNLKDTIKTGPMKLNEAIDIAVQISEGLQEAHEKGIVHRDIKPANIMITEKGQVKIMDFGLAKLSGATRLTKEGTTLGTVAYMSPEQAQGEALDHRNDIWSLGVVLYEMLTGMQPFKGEYDQAILYSIIHQQHEPATSLRSGLPLELEFILDKALAKDPAERYQHADELLTDLRRLQKAVTEGSSHRVSATANRERKKWLSPLVYITAALVAVGIAAVLLLYHPRDSIAFQERDWILITDIENLSGEEIFDKALNEAITIDIQQSRWVNVFDKSKIHQTLRLMEKEDIERVDETVGLEICKREGIKAMLVPKISRVGEIYSLSASLVDVSRGRRLSPIRVTVSGQDEILRTAVDDLSRRIRENLGESMASIERSDEKLAKVTTSSLAALEQFSLGREKHRRPKDWKEMKIFYENAIELDSTFAMAYAALGTVYGNVEEYDAARKQYRRAVRFIDNLSDRERFRILAEYYNLVESNPERAVENYRALIELYPDNGSAHNNLGRLYQQLGSNDEAIASYREGLQVDPYLMPLYNNLMILYTDLGRYDEAVEVGLQCTSIDSTYPIIYNFIGMAYLGKGMDSEAEKAIEKGLGFSPTYWGYYHLGLVYNVQERYEDAVSVFNTAHKMNPNNSYAVSGLAYAYARMGVEEKAIAMAEKALNINPIPDHYYDLACIHVILKRYDTAFRHLDTAVEKGYRRINHARTDPDFDAVRDDPRFDAFLQKIEERLEKR